MADSSPDKPVPPHIRKGALLTLAVISIAHDIAVGAARAEDIADSLGVDPPAKN